MWKHFFFFILSITLVSLCSGRSGVLCKQEQSGEVQSGQASGIASAHGDQLSQLPARFSQSEKKRDDI